MLNNIQKIREFSVQWGEPMEPPAADGELEILAKLVHQRFNLQVPQDYLEFLKICDGLEFNSLLIFGSKNSESEGSVLDIVEMNDVFRDSDASSKLNELLVAEDSTGVLTFNSTTELFIYRDRISLESILTFGSFQEAFSYLSDKVIYD